MSGILQSLTDISGKAHKLVYKHRYFHSYWQTQERMAYECSSDYLREIQWKRFKEMLEFAYSRIPFYKTRERASQI